MKVFSFYGRHERKDGATFVRDLVSRIPVKGNKFSGHFPFMVGDEWRVVAGILFTVAVCGWMLSGLERSADETPPTYTGEMQEVMATSVPAEAEVEVITIDQTEALAMGIDAVISSECKSEWVSDATLLMVANVILNRTNDSRYPNTVDQVLMQPYQFSCFSTTGMKWVGKAAHDIAFRERCMSAANAAMNGERMLNYGVVYVSSGKQGTVEAQLDGLYFCR